MDDVGVGEVVESTEVFLGDLNCGKFMNSNSEVTETEDLPDFAWLALDLGDTRVTLIGIVPSPYINPWRSVHGDHLGKFTKSLRGEISHVRGPTTGEELTVVES